MRSRKVLICNFVCSLQENKILVIVWLVANALICVLGVLALVIFYFKFPFGVLVEVLLGLSIGESVSPFSFWVRCTVVNTETL
jgi:hypothetical protein